MYTHTHLQGTHARLFASNQQKENLSFDVVQVSIVASHALTAHTDDRAHQWTAQKWFNFITPIYASISSPSSSRLRHRSYSFCTASHTHYCVWLILLRIYEFKLPRVDLLYISLILDEMVYPTNFLLRIKPHELVNILVFSFFFSVIFREFCFLFVRYVYVGQALEEAVYW